MKQFIGRRGVVAIGPIVKNWTNDRTHSGDSRRFRHAIREKSNQNNKKIFNYNKF